jgi:hypothetical protein
MRSAAVAAELDRCGAWLEAAAARSGGETSVATARGEVLANRAQLWAGDRACMVTQLHRTAADEVFIFVWLGAGDLGELLAMRPVLESWGRQQGATSARINGRLGWSRILSPFGYAEAGGELRKVLA